MLHLRDAGPQSGIVRVHFSQGWRVSRVFTYMGGWLRGRTRLGSGSCTRWLEFAQGAGRASARGRLPRLDYHEDRKHRPAAAGDLERVRWWMFSRALLASSSSIVGDDTKSADDAHRVAPQTGGVFPRKWWKPGGRGAMRPRRFVLREFSGQWRVSHSEQTRLSSSN